MRVLAVAAAMLATTVAGARPLDIYNSMRDTPITRFKQADIDLMTKTVNRALESGEDGVTVTWASPGTPNSGSVTPEKDPKGRPGCRMARVENKAGSLQNAGDYIFCRNKNKNDKAVPWQLVSPWSPS
jgi:surface antigen